MTLFTRVLTPLSAFFILGILSTNVLAQVSQESVDAIEAKADSLGTQLYDIYLDVGVVSQQSAAIDEKADRIEQKVDGVDTEVGLINQKVDAIEAKGDSIELKVDEILNTPQVIDVEIDYTPALDAIQAKADALEAKADALAVKADSIGTDVQSVGATSNAISANLNSVALKVDAIEAKLDVPDIIEIDETGPKLDAIEAKLDANFPIASVNLDPLVTLGNLLEDKVDTNGEKIDLLEAKADLLESKLDSLGGDIGGLEADILDQVNSIRDLELEQAILACNCAPGIFLPTSAGGSGDHGMALVAGLLEQIRAVGVGGLSNRDLSRAECYLYEAQQLFDGSRYGEACQLLSGSVNILSFGKTKICKKARACDRRGDDDDDDD